jgi:arylformamidase
LESARVQPTQSRHLSSAFLLIAFATHTQQHDDRSMTQAASQNHHWQKLSPQEREREYSPSSCIGGNYHPFVAAYQTQSVDARADCSALGATWSTPRYGEQAAQHITFCAPPATGETANQTTGLLVFIHGGYWQELSANDSLFPATACIQRGLAFAALDYTLAPAASVADIVAECRSALAWLFQHAGVLGVDASRIVVAGSSAGAHLAAMAAAPGALPDGAGGFFTVRAVVLVSGIYELEPLVGTTINTALGLTSASARRVSPALLPLHGFPRALVCWGAVETDEFKRQSRDFANALHAAGTPCESFEAPGRNHFDVIMDLAEASTDLGAATLSFFYAN